MAAAYALAGFASDATHISSSGTALAQTGIANAFANAANLASIVSGYAPATTTGGNGAVPAATIYTLANMLSSCVNSDGSQNGPTNPSNCYTLFNNIETDTGITATETATAAIYLAQNPYPGASQMTALLNVVSSSPPFGSAFLPNPQTSQSRWCSQAEG